MAEKDKQHPAVLDYAPPPAERRRNTAAEISFYCGLGPVVLVILALTARLEQAALFAPALSLAAVIAGIRGRNAARRDQSIGGEGTARAGIKLGWAGLIIAAAVVVVMPMFGMSHERGNRIKCQSDLRMIGWACDNYAQGHGGAFPDSFDNLLPAPQYAVFVCPSSNDDRAVGDTPEQMLAAFHQPGHCSYVYVGAGLTIKSPPKTVLAYERLVNHYEGMHVLYVDGSVVWLSRKDAESLLAQLPPEKPASPAPTSRGGLGTP